VLHVGDPQCPPVTPHFKCLNTYYPRTQTALMGRVHGYCVLAPVKHQALSCSAFYRHGRHCGSTCRRTSSRLVNTAGPTHSSMRTRAFYELRVPYVRTFKKITLTSQALKLGPAVWLRRCRLKNADVCQTCRCASEADKCFLQENAGDRQSALTEADQ